MKKKVEKFSTVLTLKEVLDLVSASKLMKLKRNFGQIYIVKNVMKSLTLRGVLVIIYAYPVI